MKKLTVGCIVAVAVLVLAGFAAWKFLPPLIEKGFHSVLNTAQNAALKQMGMGELGSATGTAYLTDIKGDVYVTHAGKRDDASQGPVAEGDVVETGAGASAALIWPDYGRTLLDENSKLTVTQANKTGDKLNVKLNVGSGRIWTRLERLLGTGSGFEVRASNVVATVRGTSFGVDHRSNEVNIQVAESHVGIQKMRTEYSDEAVGSMVLNPGEQAMVDGNIRIGMPKAAMMSNAMLNDPFIQQGNAKLDPSLMSWISKAMELYNSIPQGRDMTPDEQQALEQKALDLWNTLPEQYKNKGAVQKAQMQLNTSSTFIIK